MSQSEDTSYTPLMITKQPAPSTVRIQSDEVPGGILINESDFDPKKHKRFKAD